MKRQRGIELWSSVAFLISLANFCGCRRQSCRCLRKRLEEVFRTIHNDVNNSCLLVLYIQLDCSVLSTDFIFVQVAELWLEYLNSVLVETHLDDAVRCERSL